MGHLMEDAARTISRLRAHAARTGPEAEIAAEMLRELEAKYPAAAQAVDNASEPTAERRFCLKSWHDRQLLVRIGFYLGLDPMYRKETASRELWLRGPRAMVDAVPAIYKALGKRLEDLHRGTTTGFIIGALPIQEDNVASDRQRKGPELSQDALAAARAALPLGQRAQPRRVLVGGSDPSAEASRS